MLVKELKFSEPVIRCDGDDILVTAFLDESKKERITVLDRMTGYGHGLRDIETGYLSKDDKFWLASGNFDIREHGELSIEDAVELIKSSANNCVGV